MLKNSTNKLNKYFFNIQFLLFFIVLILIAVVGIKYVYYEKEIMEKDIFTNLSTIGDLKSEQISRWWGERIGDAKVVSGSLSFKKAVKELELRPGDQNNTDIIKAKLEPLKYYECYKEYFVIDKNGKVLSGFKKSGEIINDTILKRYLKALEQDSIGTTDFYKSADDNKARIDIIAPLYLDNIKIGGVILSIDPYQYLYPMIQTWPVKSKTAENLLFEKSGNDVLYLNELRHKKDSELNLKIPINDENSSIIAVQALSGKMGISIGIDYRSVRVLGHSAKIKNTNWYIVSKIDYDEAYNDVKYRAVSILTFLGLIIIFLASSFFWFWKNKTKSLLIQKLKSDSEIKLLKTYFNQTLKNSNDIVFITDEKGRMIDANENALRIYGYSIEEVRNQTNMLKRSPEEEAQSAKLLNAVTKNGSVIFENIHHTRGGKDIYVQGSAYLIENDGKKYVQCIIRDITEKKKAEEALRQSEERFQKMFTGHDSVMLIIDPESGLIVEGNKSAKEFYGYDFGGERKYYITELNSLPSDNVMKQIDSASHEKRNYFIFPHRLSSGEVRTVEVHSSPIDVKGKTYLFSIINDITEWKKKDDEIKEKQATLQNFFDSAPLMMGVAEVKDGKTIAVTGNKVVSEYLGTLPQNLPGQTGLELGTPEDFDRLWVENYLKSQKEKKMVQFEYEHLKGNEKHWLKSTVSHIGTGPSGNPRFSFVTEDLTEQKKWENMIKKSEETYRMLVQNLHSGIVIHAPDTSIIFSNEQAAKQLGISSDKMKGKTSDDPSWYFVSEKGDKLQVSEYPVMKVITTNSPLLNYVVGVKRNDTNQILWGLVNAYPEYSEKDLLKQVVVTFVDITEIINAEEEIKNKMGELEKFHKLTVGREMRIIELKQKINELYEKSGQKPPYSLNFLKNKEYQ